jgi:hypothetical protein
LKKKVELTCWWIWMCFIPLLLNWLLNAAGPE